MFEYVMSVTRQSYQICMSFVTNKYFLKQSFKIEKSFVKTYLTCLCERSNLKVLRPGKLKRDIRL